MSLSSKENLMHLGDDDIADIQAMLGSAETSKEKDNKKSEIASEDFLRGHTQEKVETAAEAGASDAESLLKMYKNWRKSGVKVNHMVESDFTAFLRMHNISKEESAKILRPVFEEANRLLITELGEVNKTLRSTLVQNWETLSQAVQNANLRLAGQVLSNNPSEELMKEVYLKTIAPLEEISHKMDVSEAKVRKDNIGEILKKTPLFASMSDPYTYLWELQFAVENWSEMMPEEFVQTLVKNYELLKSIPDSRTHVPQKTEEKNGKKYRTILEAGELATPGYAIDEPVSFYAAVTNTWDSVRYNYRHEHKKDLPSMADLRKSAGRSAYLQLDR